MQKGLQFIQNENEIQQNNPLVLENNIQQNIDVDQLKKELLNEVLQQVNTTTLNNLTTAIEKLNNTQPVYIQSPQFTKINNDNMIKYYDMLNKVGDTRRVIDTETARRNQSHRLAFDNHATETVQSLEKMLLEKGKTHNAELQDHIKQTTYLNNISNDYKIVTGPGGVKMVNFTSGNKNFNMPMKEFEALMGQITGKGTEKTEGKKFGGILKRRNSLYQ